MSDLPAVRWLLRLLIHPGWAPLSVVALHVVLAEYGLTERFDHLLHFVGGASISFFLFGFFALLPPRFGRIPTWVHYLLAFTSACTVAIFWEFAEFASDRILGTSVQRSISETMLDLVFGVVGAFVTLLLTAAFKGLHGARRSKAE